MKIAKFLRTPFFTERLQWLLLKNGLQKKYEISPVYLIKVTGFQRKKIVKRTHGLGWRMPAAATKVPESNYKG